MDWYQFAAERNYPAAMYEIGSLYQHGRGVSVDYFRSLEWLLKAAKGNHTDSFYNIGLQFESGWGISEDKNRAMEWFYKYAEDSTNLENLINEGHPFADDQKGI
jgi:TPR repeat protein